MPLMCGLQGKISLFFCRLRICQGGILYEKKQGVSPMAAGTYN
jgi:hypothetical protein